MDSKLAQFFRQQRLARHLKPSQLARLAGYRNVNKFCRRLQQFELKGWVHRDLLPRLTDALGIDLVTVGELMEADYGAVADDWADWVRPPIRPTLIFLLFMAADRIRLPASVRSLKQAETFASALAGERCRRARLVLSRRFFIDYGPDGEVTGYYEKRPADWIWQPEQIATRRISRDRLATLFSWPENPVEDDL